MTSSGSTGTAHEAVDKSTSQLATDSASTKSSDEVHAAEREAYVEKLQGFLPSGTYVSQDADELVIRSYVLETQDARDRMLTTFNPGQRVILCGWGIKEIKLYAMLSESSEYPICKESKHDHDQRVQDGLQKRQAFARTLASSFNRNPQIEKTDVSAIGSELVLTGKSLDPSYVRSQLPLMMDQDATANACGLGFTGMRIRTSVKSKGSFISYRCPR